MMAMQVRHRRLPLVTILWSALVLGACDYGLGTRGGLVDNSTTQHIVVEVIGADQPYSLELPAQTSGASSARNGECLGSGVALYSSDGDLLTRLDERICDGRTLTIEDDDIPSEAP